MRYAFNLPTYGTYSDVRLLAELAYEAEATGWDGFFLWDHMVWPWEDEIADPWIALTAIVLRTERIKLGPMVTPLPRRRPWKLARETVTLDHLSSGRLILGVGIGDFAQEFRNLGEAAEHSVRAAMLDEGLEVLSRLWSGEQFSYRGAHYRLEEARFRSPPLQQPRIPIWVAGTWPRPRPFRRAARWDGVVPIKAELAMITPEDVRAMAALIAAERTSAEPFEIVIGGSTPGRDAAEDAAIVAPYAEAGVTWWNEGRVPWESSLQEIRERIRRGPPRL